MTTSSTKSQAQLESLGFLDEFAKRESMSFTVIGTGIVVAASGALLWSLFDSSVPLWFGVLMVLCGFVLGGLMVFLGLTRMQSALLRHLRANPQDPAARASFSVLRNRKSETFRVKWTSDRGVDLYDSFSLLSASNQQKIVAAAREVVPTVVGA